MRGTDGLRRNPTTPPRKVPITAPPMKRPIDRMIPSALLGDIARILSNLYALYLVV
jgi:hypothetical protein